MKKIIVLALVALGAFAVYRKIQADRAELDPCDGRCCVVIRPAARTTDRPH